MFAFIGTSLQLQLIITAHTLNNFWTTSAWRRNLSEKSLTVACISGWSLLLLNESESCVTTNGQSPSLSCNKAPIWGLRPDFYCCQTIVDLLMWGALSDERTGMPLASPAQSFSSPSTPYFTASNSRLPFLSPATTRRAKVGVFDPASTREYSCEWQSQRHIATDGQSISKSWCRAPSGVHDQIFITLWLLHFVSVWCPLWREDGSAFCVRCWSSPA
jgi:hypothetical protein